MPPRPSSSSRRKPAISLPGSGSDPTGKTRSFRALSKENTTVAEALRLGDYSLELELGRGAVGVVHRGRSPDGRVVAIKTFDQALAGDETFRARLAHEARVAREIVDTHLVRILEAGEDDGHPYLVLEYLSGGSLAERLAGGHWVSRKCCGSWPRWRPASTPCTGAASSTGTSSRRTSCFARTARRR
jgi:serine/threonine protein kinase